MLSGRYTPVRRLRSGGMGDVFLAREQGADGAVRQVALRRIRLDLAHDQEFVQLFRREARVAVALTHPNIALVYEIGTADDDLYVAMEHVEGRTLRDVLDQAAAVGMAIPIEVAMAVALDVAAGLHHAHEVRDEQGELFGVVHRDLAPHNILIGIDGSARILDFGIANAAVNFDEREGMQLGGDPGYFSPEQTRLEPVNRRTDIYSLGVALWEMTAGTRLYPVADALQALQVIGHAPIPSPADVRDLPPGWEGVLRRALAADRAERHATARALQLDVEDVARSAGLAVSDMPVVALLAALFPELALDLDARRAQRPSVVVVNDEPDMLELVARILKPLADVRTAGSVADAVRVLAAARCDLVLADERMPDEPGTDLLVRVARESPSTVRILMSAYADVDLMVSAINRGKVDRFLVKPFAPDELRSMVEDALASAPRPDGTRPESMGPPSPPERPAGPPVALPWESLRRLTDAVREDALSCALLVGVADQPIRGDEQVAIQWVLERRVPHCWLHVEGRAIAVLVPGIASSFAAALAGELRDAAAGVVGTRLAVAMAELPAGDDLADLGRQVERTAVQAWLEDAEELAGQEPLDSIDPLAPMDRDDTLAPRDALEPEPTEPLTVPAGGRGDAE